MGFLKVNTIIKNTNNKNPKVIFVGDPAQLPPVNEQVSALFCGDQYLNLPSVTLKQVVRNSNQDVNNLCSDIRDWITLRTKIPKFRAYGINVRIYKYNKQVKKIETKWFNDYLNCMELSSNGTDYSTIVLTWTNEQCSEYNKVARERLLNKGQQKKSKFVVGDVLIFNDYYNMNSQSEISNKITEGTSFHTSEQIKIMEIHNIIKCSKQISEQLPKTANRMPNIGDIAKKYKEVVTYINKHTIRKI